MPQLSYVKYNAERERSQAPPKGRQTSSTKVSFPGPLTLLTFHRSLLENPLELSLEQQLALFDSKNYRSQYAYLVFKASPDNSRIVDASIVKTYVTLKLIDRQARQKGLALLLHPQPISIPQGFWREWKTAKTSSDRIDLVKKYGLAKDENIFVLARIIVDVDQPYETAQETVLKVFQKLGIDNGFLLGKSKSGNLRGVIWLSPTNILVGYKIVKEEKHEIYKDFYLSPHAKHKNGHTHLENLKELLAILYGLLEKEGLKVDWSFFDRINHPIWYSSVDSKFFKPVLSRSGTVRLYDLYNRAKKVQEQEGLWEVPRRGKPFNLTQHFWPRYYKPPQEKRIQIPAFIRNHFDAYVLWKKAVESLANTYRSERFKRVIAPAVGWAIYLNISRHEVESLLEGLLPDKKNLREDIEKAYRWSDGLPFNTPNGTLKTLKFSDYLQKVIDYLENHEGKAKRQELLSEIFNGQVWLLELVMRYLEKKNYVESYQEKSGRRGRPFKVYVLSKATPLECDSQSPDSQAPYKASDSTEEVQVNFMSNTEEDFSQNITSPSDMEGEAIYTESVDGLGVVGSKASFPCSLSLSVGSLGSLGLSSQDDESLSLRRSENLNLRSENLSPRSETLGPKSEIFRRDEGHQIASDDLPVPPISREELRKAIFKKRAVDGVSPRPEVLKLVQNLRRTVYPSYLVEFYATSLTLYLYICDMSTLQVFKRLDVDLSKGLNPSAVSRAVQEAIQEHSKGTISKVEREGRRRKQDHLTTLLERFLISAGLELESILEVVEFAKRIKGLSWKVQGSTLRWVVDGVEVEGLDLDLRDLRSLGKEEVKNHILIAIERVAEIEPKWEWNGLSYETALQEKQEGESRQDNQTTLLEMFLTTAGLKLEDVVEVVEFVKKIGGIGWIVQDHTLKWLIDGTEVEGLDLSVEELRKLDKEEAKNRVLIAIEKVGEIEPTGGCNESYLS